MCRRPCCLLLPIYNMTNNLKNEKRFRELISDNHDYLISDSGIHHKRFKGTGLRPAPQENVMSKFLSALFRAHI
uniref:Envelope glycoprotein n=1 Tax=Siphoviridae sp. ctf8W5 TaxID=2825595 RepID=A0A8S5Q7Q3_9CAUD|nr:MAG TPA: envelope glycoprotein [Siphoviridae sp. ctf8W5]